MKYYLTTPIFYVNAKPHIAHAYTALAADVIARVHRLKGDDVFLLTGTDEHGDKISDKAKEAGMEPLEFCNKISQEFKIAWKNLDISYDKFIRTTSEEHIRGAQFFITKLKEKGDVYEKDYEGLYCVGCEKFMTEKELVDGKCPDHKIKPELIKEKNYFFKLSKYLDQIKEIIKNDQLLIRPAERRREVLSILEQGLEDFSISRQSVKWGIEVPFDKNQNIYVWVEALTNYINALGYGSSEKDLKNFNKYWPAELHLIGKDIVKFHAIYWPAMLLALGLPLPNKIFAHGFFTISGQKMSKTLGNVIDPNDLVKKWGTDAARYLILAQFPFGDDGDISLERMQAQYEADLANDLGNLLQRILVMMNKYEVEKIKIESNPYQGKIDTTNLTGLDIKNYLKHFDNLEIKAALDDINKIISNANRYIEQEKPWELAKKDMDKGKTVLQNLYKELTLVAGLIEPFMPQKAAEINRQLTEMKPEPIFKK